MILELIIVSIPELILVSIPAFFTPPPLILAFIRFNDGAFLSFHIKDDDAASQRCHPGAPNCHPDAESGCISGFHRRATAGAPSSLSGALDVISGALGDVFVTLGIFGDVSCSLSDISGSLVVAGNDIEGNRRVITLKGEAETPE